MNRSCNARNIKIDISNYKKYRTVCRTCYNKNDRKNNSNTLPPNTNTAFNQQLKIENVNNNNNRNRLTIVGFSNCGKTSN